MKADTTDPSDAGDEAPSRRTRSNRNLFVFLAFALVVVAATIAFIIAWPTASKSELCVPTPFGDDACVKAEKEPASAAEAMQSADKYVFTDMGFEIDKPKGTAWSDPEIFDSLDELFTAQGVSPTELDPSPEEQFEQAAEDIGNEILLVASRAAALDVDEVLRRLGVTALDVGLAVTGEFEPDAGTQIVQSLGSASGLEVEEVLDALETDLASLTAELELLQGGSIDLEDEIPSVRITHGEPIDVGFTEDSVGTDFVVGELQFSESDIDFSNAAVFSTFPKQDGSELSLAEFAVFLAAEILPGQIASFSADEERVLFVMDLAIDDVIVEGDLTDLSMTRAVLIEESEDTFYVGEVAFTDVAGASVAVWEQLFSLLESFRRVV